MITENQIIKYSSYGALFIATAIGLGAIGAHALEGVTQITPKNIESWKTGVQYQLIQGIGLFIIVFLTSHLKLTSIKSVLYIHITGTLLFSLSIYLLVLNAIWQQLWIKYAMIALTPIGGVLMIIGWLMLVVKLAKLKRA